MEGRSGPARVSKRCAMADSSSFSSARPDLLDFIALSLLPPWSWISVTEALRDGDPPASVFARTAARLWPNEPARVDAIRARVRPAAERAAAHGLDAITWSDARYPAALAAIADPPPVLWTIGDVTAFDVPLVAIVGSRAASPYALSVAATLAADLASRGVAVVSGLARGVDSAAHRGALEVDGATIGVLGSGADVIYPPEHAPLARDMARRGLVVSELVPGTPPQRQWFPLRNRIISGLSRAVVVIEAGEKSGSLITARSALEQGRDVLAVPGNILNGRHRGAHALLRDGAKIVESAVDILEELGMGRPDVRPAGAARPCRIEQRHDPVLDCLEPGEAIDLDAIAERSGLAPSRLLPRLMELELQGAVARVGGGRFVRTSPHRA